MEVNNCLKYFIVIRFSDVEGIAIWGTDSKQNEENKFLLNSNGKILLFETEKDASFFCLKNQDLLFDRNIFLKWIKVENKAENKFNFNILLEFSSNVSFTICKKTAYELIDIINLIEDYASQTRNQKLLKSLEESSMEKLIDWLYSIYFWKESKPNFFFTDALFIESKKALKLLYNEFTICFKQIKPI